MPSAKILEEKGVLRMHRRGTLTAMFLAGFIYFAQTVAGQTQTPTPSNSSTLPPSASKAVMASEGGPAAEDRRHWEDFLKLADKPNAVFTLQDVEAAFGGKLVTGEPKYIAYYKLGSFLRYQAVDDPSYSAKYPGRGKDSITLLLREKDARTCLPRSKITRDLQKAGWKFLTHNAAAPGFGSPRNCPKNGLCPAMTPPVPANDDFTKGDQGILYVYYLADCPSEILMRADRDVFKLIPSRSPRIKIDTQPSIGVKK